MRQIFECLSGNGYAQQTLRQSLCLETQFRDGSRLEEHPLGGAAKGEDLGGGPAEVVYDGAIRGGLDPKKERVGMDQAPSEEVDYKRRL